MARFPKPCPVCGDEEEHASWRETATDYPGWNFAATFCPHPAEPGHGTGCCCAGLAIPPWIVRPEPPESPTLEERVAALEDAAKHMRPAFTSTQVRAIAAQIQVQILEQAKRSRRGSAA